MSEIRKFDVVDATIKMRRGQGWEIKPEAGGLDGLRVRLMASWRMTKADTSIYVGEFAMTPHDDRSARLLPFTWIASGDITDIRRPA